MTLNNWLWNLHFDVNNKGKHFNVMTDLHITLWHIGISHRWRFEFRVISQNNSFWGDIVFVQHYLHLIYLNVYIQNLNFLFPNSAAKMVNYISKHFPLMESMKRVALISSIPTHCLCSVIHFMSSRLTYVRDPKNSVTVDTK